MSDNRYCTYCCSDTKQKKVFEVSKVMPIEIAVKENKYDVAKALWIIGAIMEEVFQCLGCERVHIYYTNLHVSPDESAEKIRYQLPMRKERPIPKWLVDVNLDYLDLVSEIYASFNYGHYISFSIASRALLDVVLTELLGDIGGLQKKLVKSLADGHITKGQCEVLSFLVNSGNASAHRAYRPTKEVAAHTLDIIEHLLKDEVLSKRTKLQRPDIPERSR